MFIGIFGEFGITFLQNSKTLGKFELLNNNNGNKICQRK